MVLVPKSNWLSLLVQIYITPHLGLFFMTYMPQYITVHLLHFCKSCQESINFHKVDVAASRLLCLSSAMNPFVYAWRVPKYRSAFIECLKIIRKRL